MKDWELSRMCVCVCVCERERVRESNVNDECLFVTAKGKKISNVKKGAVDFFSIRPVRQKIRRNRDRKTDTERERERERASDETEVQREGIETEMVPCSRQMLCWHPTWV